MCSIRSSSRAPCWPVARTDRNNGVQCCQPNKYRDDEGGYTRKHWLHLSGYCKLFTFLGLFLCTSWPCMGGIMFLCIGIICFPLEGCFCVPLPLNCHGNIIIYNMIDYLTWCSPFPPAVPIIFPSLAYWGWHGQFDFLIGPAICW